MKYTIKSKAHNSAICTGNSDMIIERWDRLERKERFIIVNEKGETVDIDDVGMDEIIEPEVEEKPRDNTREWPWQDTFK